MPIFPLSFFAADHLRQQVRHALRDLPAATPGAGAQDGPLASVGPRMWVSSLAGEALWLGSYQSTYDLSGKQWSDIATHLSSYGNLPLMRPLDVAPAQRSNEARLRDERPLVDAVLQLSRHRPLDDLTFADVAAASGHALPDLQAAFGEIDLLLIDVVRQVHDDGFNEISPLRFHLDRHTLTMSLEGLEDERRITAAHRLYALAGARPKADTEIRARARTMRRVSTRSLENLDLMTASLAVDGWQGALDVPAFYPRSLPRAVVRELGRLAHVPSS